MSEPKPAPASPQQDPPSPAVAGILAWLIPGAGHFYLGHNGKALLFCFSILALMLFGSALGEWKVVVMPEPGPEREAVTGDNVWFLVHLCAGLVTLLFAGLNKGVEVAAGTTQLVEIGHLYTRVAGMLNLLLIVDVVSRAQMAGIDSTHAAEVPQVTSVAGPTPTPAPAASLQSTTPAETVPVPPAQAGTTPSASPGA